MELQENYGAFQSLNAEIVSIAQLEKDPGMLGRIEEFVGNTFPIVADPDQVTRRAFKIFGVYLVDKEGILRKFIPGTKEARPRLDVILKELAELEGAEAPEAKLIEGKVIVDVPGESMAKVGRGEDVVKARWMLSHDVVRAGDEFKVAFLPQIVAGYHVYGAADKTMTPFKVEVEVPKGVELADTIRYPRAKSHGDKSLGAEVTSYKKDVPISCLAFKASDDLEGEEVVIRAKVSYQACNDSMCFPPTTKTFVMTLPVASVDRRRGQVFGWQSW